MKKIINFKASILVIALASMACNETFAVTQKTTAQTPPSSQSYGCGSVYPTQVYCPKGQLCVFPGPTCIMSIAAGGTSVSEETYDLNVPSTEFKNITISEAGGTQLPISLFPALGKRVAYQLTPKTGTFAGVPFNVVIQTELPTEAFINKIAQGIGRLTDATQKEAAQLLVSTLQNLKSASQGINAVYRSVPSLGETKYKLYHVRVPGTNSAQADIKINSLGNLQFYEKDSTTGKTNIIEIDTGNLSK